MKSRKRRPADLRHRAAPFPIAAESATTARFRAASRHAAGGESIWRAEGDVLDPFNSWHLIAAGIGIGLVGGFLRGISGFGAALGMVPLLALLLPTRVAVVTVVLTTLITNVPMSYSTRREADWATVAWVSAGAMVGLFPGLWLLYHLPSEVLRRLVGGVVIASTALLGFARPRHSSWPPPLRVGAGVVSGVLNGAVSLGGPPVVLYFLWTTTTAETSRASFVAYFTVIQLVQLVALTWAGQVTLTVLGWTAVVAPAMLAGTVAGSWLFRAGGHRHFRRISLLLLAVTGLAALLR
jgi:uncharacterized membrane protein YfcA